MTRTSTATLAVAADYADAMITARRAKNWLFILVLFVLLSQLAVFFLVKFNVLKLEDRVTTPAVVDGASATAPATAAVEAPSTAPAETTAPVVETRSYAVATILRYVIPLQNFLGITLM